MKILSAADIYKWEQATMECQELAPAEATILGVYLHGLAGDLAAISLHQKSITATDIIEHISGAWQHLGSVDLITVGIHP